MRPQVDGHDMSPAYLLHLHVEFERLKVHRAKRLEHLLRKANALWSRLGVSMEEERALLERVHSKQVHGVITAKCFEVLEENVHFCLKIILEPLPALRRECIQMYNRVRMPEDKRTPLLQVTSSTHPPLECRASRVRSGETDEMCKGNRSAHVLRVSHSHLFPPPASGGGSSPCWTPCAILWKRCM
jgi:hypothetical protein